MSLRLNLQRAHTATSGLVTNFVRPVLAMSSAAAPLGTRFYAKKKDGTAKVSSKQMAAQRERQAAALQLKRREQKKMALRRLEARRALDTPLKMDISTALRYLRAAEVGYPSKMTTITMTVSVVAERGTPPLNGSVRLPKGLDMDQRIAVFTLNPETAEAALKAGAAVAGGEELIEAVQNGQIDFNKALATPDIVAKLNTVARILGPKGLMPATRRGTVSANIVELVSNSLGRQDFRQRSVPSVSIPVGRANFSDADVIKNLIAAIDSVREASGRVVTKKPVILGQTTISSSHGPGIVIDV